MRRDLTTADTRLADDPMVYNPATVDKLVQLMLGGLPPGMPLIGGPLHCRVRYFDPLRRRAGATAGEPPESSMIFSGRQRFFVFRKKESLTKTSNFESEIVLDFFYWLTILLYF